jgi:hypothetical protein
MAIFKKKKTCVHLKKNHVAKTKESTYILHYERKQFLYLKEKKKAHADSLSVLCEQVLCDVYSPVGLNRALLLDALRVAVPEIASMTLGGPALCEALTSSYSVESFKWKQ